MRAARRLGRRRQQWIADVKLRMRGEDTIGEQIADVCLRPAVHDAPRDEMEIGARVHVVRDRGCDDREDVRGAFPSVVEPSEEPVPSAQNQATEFAFPPVVRRFDVPVVEEEKKTMPLTVKVAERLA
jgi:hypothetical protein